VGKTATAVNVSVGLAKAGKRTMLIDLDPRCEATSGIGGKAVDRHYLLRPNVAMQDCTQRIADLDLLPGSSCRHDIQQLAAGSAEDHLALAQRFRQCVADHDFVILDCPPTLMGATQWAMMAADELVLPLECEYFALEGVPPLIELVRRVMRVSEQALDFAGVLINKFNECWKLAEDLENQVREFFGEVVFQTVIPFDQTIAAASTRGRSVIDQAPRSRAARAYIELCKEVIEQ
jgi:chromosome partitioning protein